MDDLEVAVASARAGAAVLVSSYGTELDRTAKSDTDFATVADLAAERAILDVIRAERPGDTVVGEELGETVGHGDRRWLVDPLCGTLNFAATTPLYCVNVALRVGGTTTVAVVAHPPSGELYSCDRGVFEVRARTSAPPSSRIVDINADGPLDHRFVGARLAADPDLRSRYSPRVESTTLALAWVAAGQRLGYVTDGRHRDSVHFAAGLALCEAAGCTLSDFDGGPVHEGPGLVVAADADTHRTLLELVQRYR